jgi:hypothetical protein
MSEPVTFQWLFSKYTVTMLSYTATVAGIVFLPMAGIVAGFTRHRIDSLKERAVSAEQGEQRARAELADAKRQLDSKLLGSGDGESKAPEERAREIAAELRKLQRDVDAADADLRIVRAKLTDAEWASTTRPQERHSEVLEDALLRYRQLKTEAISIRDQLVSKVSREVIRSRPDAADNAYLGPGMYSNYEDIAKDLELLARARRESK